MPLPTSQREESAPEAFEEQAVDAPGIGLCARPPEVEYDEPMETTKSYRQPPSPGLLNWSADPPHRDGYKHKILTLFVDETARNQGMKNTEIVLTAIARLTIATQAADP
jgi:hypothetical protein